MNAIIILLIIDTIVQFVVCHFSLFWIIALVGRFLFSLRIVGATFKVHKLCIVEGVSLVSVLLWHMIVHKGAIPWVNILLYALFSFIACALMFIDNAFYVYYTDDDDGE